MLGITPAITRLCDENVDVRRRAINELDISPIAHRYALRHVLMTDNDAEARANAARKLGESRFRRATAALVEATHDPMPSVRDHALRALGKMHANDIGPIATEAVRHEPVWWVRRSAIRAAAAALGTDALSLLIEALSDPFWRVRHAAVQALVALGDGHLDVQEQVRHAEHLERQRTAGDAAPPSPVAFAVKYLDAVWNNHPIDDAVLLGSSPSVIPFVPQVFVDEDPAVVTARLEKARDDDIPSRALVVWLGNPHAALRTLARRKLRERNDLDALVDALRWFDEPRIPHAAAEVQAICDRLGADDITLARRVLAERVSPGTLAWAAEVASLRGCPESIERVRMLARADAPELRQAAIRGLARDERSLDIVLAALNEDDTNVRAAALAAWESRPSAPRVLEAWVAALIAFAPRATTVRERRAVVEAAALGGDEALLNRALADADPSVVATALSALGAMNALGSSERIRALTHEDPWIRGAALDVDAAVRTAMNETDPWVCRAATDLVVRNRATVSPSELRAVGLSGALHPDAWVRARVAELLDPRHHEELRALLRLSGDTAPMVRAAAATVLEETPDLEAYVSALIDAAEVDDVVRKSAFTWLLRRGDDAAFRLLIEAFERGTENPDVAQHLEALSLVFPEESFERAPHVQSRRPVAVVVDETRVRSRRVDVGHVPALRTLGQTGLCVSPLVLSGAHGLPATACMEAYDAGVRAFFWEPRYHEKSRFLRTRRITRDSFVVVAGTYYAGAEAIRIDVERTLRQLRTDWIDVFLLFWVRSSERVSNEDFAALEQLRSEGKLRTFGFSSHDRTICVRALNRAPWPVVMTRHSAAHPGAEESVFPTAISRGTGILTFTATCYGRMLRPTLQTTEASVIEFPTAADCYRYSLSQPGVSACLTAPRNRDELFENLEVLDGKDMGHEAVTKIRAHGVAVRAENRRFDTLVRRAPGGPHDRLHELLDER